jgi:ADP-ribose pyrophosphatase YjhB (NUDIX family)
MKITAQVVLINPEGFILGVSRKDDHNDFGLIGGKMDLQDNNDPILTAIRETREETGLEIGDLRLIFAIHKEGFMGYTYLADYSGEINHNEPHVVKWVAMERLVLGSFGKYNKMVSESLDDMGIKYQYKINLSEVKVEIEEFVNNRKYDGMDVLFNGIRNSTNWLGTPELTVYMTHADGSYLYEKLCGDDDFENGLVEIGKRHGFNARISNDYFSK